MGRMRGGEEWVLDTIPGQVDTSNDDQQQEEMIELEMLTRQARRKPH